MGLLGGIGDAVGSALDSAADAVGIPEGIQDTVGAVGNAVTGDFVDAGQQAADAVGGLLGDGGGGNASRGRARTTGIASGQQMPQLPAPTPDGGGRDSTGVSGEISVPGLGSIGGEFSTVSEGGGSGGSNQSNQGDGTMMPTGGGFQNAIMMEMLEDAISGQDGRAVLEAMTSGALQNGVIQRPANVNTPRGTRNVSPPGFRTVYLGGDSDADAYAVFKPLAKSLGLIGRESPRTFREKLDDTTREFLKHRSQFKDLAKKLGLKTSNRASGPSR